MVPKDQLARQALLVQMVLMELMEPMEMTALPVLTG
jgi:hypothetical protein